MAKRFRIESLTPAQQKELNNFLGEFVPQQFHVAFLDSLEQTGSIPDELFDRAKFTQKDRAFVAGEIGNITRGLPSKKEALEKFIGTDVAEQDLTTQELQDRIVAFEGLSQPLEKVRKPDVKRLANEITDFTLSNVEHLTRDWLMGGATPAAMEIAKDFLNNRFSIQRFAELIQNNSGGEVGQVKAEQLKDFGYKVAEKFNERVGSGEFSYFDDIPGRTVTEDVKRIQDILTFRQAEAGKEAGARSFLAELPEELRRGRESFLAGREKDIGSVLRERIAPRAVSQLNVFGLAQGPDVGGVIASEAGILQAGLESTLRDIEAADNALYGEAAFKLTLSKLEQTEEQFRATLTQERERARQEQEQRFTVTETALQNQFGLDILRREQDRALRLRKTALELGQNASDEQFLQAISQDLALSGGKLVGTGIASSGSGTKTTTDTTAGTTTGGKTVTTKPAPSFNRIG